MTVPTSDPLGQRGVRRAYDTVAETYAAYFPDLGAESPLDRAMIDAFAELVTSGGDAPVPDAPAPDAPVPDAPVPDAPVLDAGCGTGRVSRYLAGRGCAVQGVDLSPGMIAAARRANPELTFTVGSLTDLPFPDDHFAGVLLWFSIIHTPPAGQARIFAEVARVLRPAGHVLVGFQCGEGVRDVAPAYRPFGHEIRLQRHRYTADQVAAALRAAGLRETARMVRGPQGVEKDDHAVLLAEAR